MIDISKMDKAEVLAKLYNASRAQGMGMLHFTPQDMTVEEARALLGDESPKTDIGLPARRMYFDYLRGRVMKIDLSGDQLREDLYDRDNGKGAAARALGLE